MQAEAVNELRTKLSFFRVAGADQHEARGMLNGNTFALDEVSSGDGDIKQQINQVIFEEIHFVNIEEAAIGAREQSGFK